MLCGAICLGLSLGYSLSDWLCLLFLVICSSEVLDGFELIFRWDGILFGCRALSASLLLIFVRFLVDDTLMDAVLELRLE